MPPISLPPPPQGFECGNIRVARRKRAYRTLPLCIGPDGPPFMVRAYYTVKKTPLPSPGE